MRLLPRLGRVPRRRRADRLGSHARRPRKLHRIENPHAEPLDDEALDAWLVATDRKDIAYSDLLAAITPDAAVRRAWLVATDRKDIAYSDLLAAITPDAAVRREYLAGFFEGKEPGPTHDALAHLAERGLVRVFVTTNFDRLLEHALQARGIEPIVIASDADLEAAPPREHASCYVLKPHGDYLRDTIRNAPEELAQLDPAVTAELSEVFSRYGVDVLGYSGSDEGIGRALRGRRSRFGVSWQARGQLQQPAAELVEAIGARVVHRGSTSEFLADLERRLAVFEEHPSGVTPAAAHAGLVTILRAGDSVGIDGSLRHEQHHYESEVDRIAADALARFGNITEPELREVWSSLRPVFERRLATLLPLALYDPERLAAEFTQITRSLERRPTRGGLTFWISLAEYPATLLGYICGALLVRVERFEVLPSVLGAKWTDTNGVVRPMIWLPGDLSTAFGQLLVEGPEGQNQRWVAPEWEFMTRTLLHGMDWVREGYPELVAEREPRASLAQFDLVLCIHYHVIEHRRVAYFALDPDASMTFAQRLHRDSRLRERVAQAVGLTLEEFDAQAPQALRDSFRIREGFTTAPAEIATVLETGSR